MGPAIISTNDVESAARACNTLWKEWGNFEFRKVTISEMSDAEGRVRASQVVLNEILLEGMALNFDLNRVRRGRGSDELERLQEFPWIKYKSLIVIYWLIDRTQLLSLGPWVGAILTATVGVVLSCLPLMMIFGTASKILLGFVWVYVVCFFVSAGLLIPLSRRDIESDDRRIRGLLSNRREQIRAVVEKESEKLRSLLLRNDGQQKAAEAELSSHRKELHLLRRILTAQQSYEQAVLYRTRLEDTLRSRRYQLTHTDWKALRGIPFEDFVAEIFAELGFVVEKTKASGDQGVDLIVRGKGRAIAVQVKGYGGSVGNAAIQQAFAGMAFYGCRECMAVTNSSFTTGAIQLANSVRCRLVDGDSIPNFIEGRLPI